MPGLFDGTPLEQPVTCPRCTRTLDACACPRNADGSIRDPRDQAPRVRREKRRGKWATIVADLHPDDANELLKPLKNAMSTGGGLTEGDIILQGDHRDRVVDFLRKQGFAAKPAGG